MEQAPEQEKSEASINIKVKPSLYKEFQKVCIDENTTVSDAFREFMRKKVYDHTGVILPGLEDR